MRPSEEEGSTTLPAVAFMGVLLLLGLAAAFVTAGAAAHRRAQSAADLAALAGAGAVQQAADACAKAADVAASNGASLRACVTDGEEVRVTVRVPSPEFLGHSWVIEGSARAGPG